MMSRKRSSSRRPALPMSTLTGSDSVRSDRHFRSARVIRSLSGAILAFVVAFPLAAQVNAPPRQPRASTTQREAPPAIVPLPDTAGFGVPVLAIARSPFDSSLWVGTYGRGIYTLRPGDSTWTHLTSDDDGDPISFDFIHAIAFPRPGVVWYGAVGNGWGMSRDDGKSWKNWTGRELGPEYQYTAPDGIVSKGDTVYIATADGVMVTWDDGNSWEVLVDSAGPQTNRLGAKAYPVLKSEYVKRILVDRRGLAVETIKGNQRLARTADGWVAQPAGIVAFKPRNSAQLGRWQLKGTNCGLQVRGLEVPCYSNARN